MFDVCSVIHVVKLQRMCSVILHDCDKILLLNFSETCLW